MIKVLFVCHGSICRSPLAEYLLRDMLRREGLEAAVSSAAVSPEELGNPVYPPVRRMLAARGIDCSDHRARVLTRADYGRWDLIIGMGESNLRGMRRILGADPDGKLRLLSDFASFSGDVEDPWYTGNFEKVFCQIEEGCRGLVELIARESGGEPSRPTSTRHRRETS